MKKQLLLFYLLVAFNSHGQQFWDEYATAQPMASTAVGSISIVNENLTWLNMQCADPTCTLRRYAKTINGGTTWTTGTVDLGPDFSNLVISNIHGVSEAIAFAAVYSMSSAITPGGVWKTSDGGASWIRQPSASYNSDSSFTNLVYFWDADNGLTMGDPANGYFEIYTTSDGGTNWSRVPANPALIPLDGSEYGLTNNFTVSGNTIWTGTSEGRILKSTDRGLTWTSLISPMPDLQMAAMAFTDQNNGLIQSDSFNLYDTHDGGVTWSQVPYTGPLRNLSLTAVPGMANAYISVGQFSELSARGSSYSVDGGETWVSMDTNPDLNNVTGFKVAIFDADHGFAGGYSVTPNIGGIYGWTGGSLLRTAHLLSVSSFTDKALVTACPNPTTGNLHIAGKNIRQINVYDLIGKPIVSNNYGAVNEDDINLEPFANGIYLVKVVSDSGTVTMKVSKN